MKYKAGSADQYIEQLPGDRKEAVSTLRGVILKNLPEGFEEQINYGMIGYVVPLSVYPKGYHLKKNEPLPFINIANQKNHIALYHLGLYTDKVLIEWFIKEYPRHSKNKLDMGKSCIRFKNPDQIPYILIGELAGKITVQQWIYLYEERLKP